MRETSGLQIWKVVKVSETLRIKILIGDKVMEIAGVTILVKLSDLIQNNKITGVVPIKIRRRTSNLYIITFREEDMILSHSFEHIKASIKDLIKIYNDDFSANN